MLCSRPRPLNAIAPVPGLPNAQRERPSRVAGSFFVKSFGRRQAYESPRGTNPRAAGDGYGDFDFRSLPRVAWRFAACTLASR